MQTVTTIRFDQETLGQLDGMATSLGRPRSWVVKEAVKRYLGYETWFREEVQKGLDAVAEGKTVSHEEVKNSIRDMGIHVD
jgi:predicted transcriptional regulator